MALVVELREIKEVKRLMKEVDSLRDNTYREGDYTFDYSGKEAFIEAKEKVVEKNVRIYAKLLGVSYDTVIDMCYDFDFAKEVLADIYKKSA